MNIEDMIADQQMVISLTHSGYVEAAAAGRPTASSAAAASG